MRLSVGQRKNMANEFKEALKSRIQERRLRQRYKKRKGEKIKEYKERLNRVFERYGREKRFEGKPSEMEKTISAGQKLFKKYKERTKKQHQLRPLGKKGGFWTGTKMLYDEDEIKKWKKAHPGGWDPKALK